MSADNHKQSITYFFFRLQITIMCNLYHAHLNEAYWKDGDKFVPERWIPGEKEYDESNDFGAFFPFSSG